MRCIDGENELILTCETQAEGVCILRCETCLLYTSDAADEL